MRVQLVEDIKKKHERLFCYCHSSMSEEERSQQVSDFVKGKKPFMVSTSVLGAGYDFPNVDWVIHLDMAYGLTDFLQESGRAGRKPGRRGFSYILTTPRDQKEWKGDTEEKGHMRAYLREDFCRRRHFHLHFNQKLIENCQPGEVACDLCEARQKEYDSNMAIVQQHIFSSLIYIAFIAL